MPLSRMPKALLDAEVVGHLRQIERDLQPEIVRLRWSVGENWSGDPAIFFRIVLSDTAGRRDDLAEFTGKIGTQIFDVLQEADVEYVPYFNFRTESEQKRLNDPEWD